MTNYIRALVDAESAKGESGTPIRFIASTEGVKRDGLNLHLNGMKLDNFRANPIFLWVHDYMGERLPIGRVVSISTEPTQMPLDVVFDQEDEFARQVESKYRRGFLNAVSIGWNPLKTNGRDVLESDLLDVSGVPVPGDPQALMERQMRGYEFLQKQLTDILNTSASDSDESAWKRTASDMLDLFLSGDSLDENERKARYNQLVKEYRKLNKVAPEWTTVSDVETVRGLFLENEFEMFPEKFVTGERKGAVLNARNRADLTQAIELINGVLERATKEEDTEPRDEHADALRAILETLNKGK